MSREKPALLTRGPALTGTVTGRMTYPQHQQIRKQKFPDGTLVRADKALSRKEFASRIPSGAVFSVVLDTYSRDGEPWYRITGGVDFPPYILPESALKLAKQAEAKRQAYINKRG